MAGQFVGMNRAQGEHSKVADCRTESHRLLDEFFDKFGDLPFAICVLKVEVEKMEDGKSIGWPCAAIFTDSEPEGASSS